MKKTNFNYIAVVFVLCFAPACSQVSGGPSSFHQMLGLEGFTLISTGKTIADHIVSFTTGKDCSTVRKNVGQHYCEEDDVAVQDEVFCYKTLGDVSCYPIPAPHGEKQQSLGQYSDLNRPPR